MIPRCTIWHSFGLPCVDFLIGTQIKKPIYKNQTSTTKLAIRDHVIVKYFSTLPDDILGTQTWDIGLLETANKWGVQIAVVFGTGTSLTLLRNKPYIIWYVQIDTLNEIDDICSSWFIPCGQQFPYNNATIGSLSVVSFKSNYIPSLHRL